MGKIAPFHHIPLTRKPSFIYLCRQVKMGVHHGIFPMQPFRPFQKHLFHLKHPFCRYLHKRPKRNEDIQNLISDILICLFPASGRRRIYRFSSEIILCAFHLEGH